MSPELVHYPKAQNYYNLENIQSPRPILLGNIFNAQYNYCLSIRQKPKTITSYQYIKSPRHSLLDNIFKVQTDYYAASILFKAQDYYSLANYYKFTKPKIITIWRTFYLKPKTNDTCGDYYYLSHTI